MAKYPTKSSRTSTREALVLSRTSTDSAKKTSTQTSAKTCSPRSGTTQDHWTASIATFSTSPAFQTTTPKVWRRSSSRAGSAASSSVETQLPSGATFYSDD